MRIFSLRSAFTFGRNPSTLDLFMANNMLDELDHFEEEIYVRIPRRHFIIISRRGWGKSASC